ncbi:hypothetical protein C7C46_11705 [Streptomyces tateyamensis]|uniref:DUF3592 domain-containing protein n=1 Tax=Streptomyces tateyamensis TaxID=565073 RepID=A0A2V4NNQ1_9ACTN|nr:hypothetical protein [Streptomyces tateyamensis]PYC81370.1 hypothetical protein C7C46_11705 [Streptomyces tateyamensis]
MRSPSPSAVPRIGRGWYLAAVLSAVVALGMCLLGWRQTELADKIGADPVRVQGTITQLSGGSATYSAVSYQAGGQQHSAADLQLPAEARVGDSICLEHAATDAGAVRLCDQKYPQAAGIRLAQISVPVALLVCALCVLRIRRHFRSPAVRSAQAVVSTMALAAEALADGMPAITHGKRSRRRHRSPRRALR